MKGLPEHMAFYAAYHRDPRNVATHAVGVPVIVFSLMVVLSLAMLPGTGVSLALVVTAVLLLYYVVLDGALGIAMAIVLLPLLWLADGVAGAGTATALAVFLVLFVGGWALQLIGHKLEGNRPALTASLFQVFMAPIFLMAEAFFALGLRSELRHDVERRVLTRDAASAVSAR
jgi:uncharacterized membrane protein YGL010W